MEFEKKDQYMRVFIGTEYTIGKPATVGELRSLLEQMADDLPDDKGLEISEVYLDQKRGVLGYVLKEGIPD